MTRVLAVVAVSAIAILLAAAASAEQRSRAPSRSERTEIARAIKYAWKTDPDLLEPGWSGWKVLLLGTDYASVCLHPNALPAPARELICR